MKKLFLLPMLLLSALVCKADNLDGAAFLQSLEGTYVELFTSETCLNPEYEFLWIDEAAKFVGKDHAQEAVKQLVGACQGTLIGEEAVAAYSPTQSFRFCCAFQQGVAKLTFEGNRIYGVDNQGQQIFSHTYHFVEMDSEGNYLYESDDTNDDEFRFFWMRPDSPSETYHIEFRYGSDKAQLTQLMTGEYAFWMASGVREGKKDEYKNSILLFVDENLGAKE